MCLFGSGPKKLPTGSIRHKKPLIKKKGVFVIDENQELELASEATGIELHSNGDVNRQQRNLNILKEKQPEIFEIQITVSDGERETTQDSYLKYTNLERTMSYLGSMRSKTSLLSRMSSLNVKSEESLQSENSHREKISIKDIFDDIGKSRDDAEDSRKTLSLEVNRKSALNLRSHTNSTLKLSPHPSNNLLV
ncbi:Oidioi.mRNA.OKI2018_I69.chr2.g4434.t1.cds [Oikopleura dioica]|uniref:Oidioi.mRNA.OKI2018_I69.chr2.g4434.t1.cds n=1 Tax=Oikopleura dioica TaxID=34765 RepID=A0ABN7SXQ8_OIKDI|nr:Oidioi.mRNA.OKI2018_I69.chr2.g4434.t1.cds [Oikopleura dioica]